ncbi:dihydroorotate dehydrogenase electron transfer subunit [Tuwongella immobilis]|uniref:FAD-binding FR-type domain-containing protein n=1 Tax=Tuwongella immobilis TaxID=692036 RepID=A0A6C2YMS3_9BACT|nr:dihydroorotate dehydrogenase electron transfer subunit [Tuwongella immobilis]VIP02621.1 oxidoreductase fad nad -binding domain protein : Dihydroorotate dehydrogenase B (NAD(+)), electron transfer subunit OS=Planctomyces maris DSM 8797 GN=pyrK PE=3 SV=1: FAD_binding_6: NAD_binding_1: DHODB_Fe-S_bind [Tuwongella immobilis]VTS01951.1 oxidoreductase fad nad -binding domain protein : Dihydroorotate dehydrogenase B (NAD(+)), electron transfer subunit OS=Planctomyces maris DSM 8797 GN=pyrK PE=3 SV=1:
MTCAARHVTAIVLENVPLAERTFRIRLAAPQVAATMRPGQFLMLRLPGRTDPLLGRPFALYDTVLNDAGECVALDVVYLVLGKMTRPLSELQAGDAIEVLGPLGNGFLPIPPAKSVWMIAGGIGQTPFLATTRWLRGTRGYAGDAPRQLAEQVEFFYGVRSASFAAGVADFAAAGATVSLASDDGSIGHHGRVTELLPNDRRPDAILTCGPEPMLKAVARWALERGIPCQVSLETPMACGVGICFSCVTKVQLPQSGWDYKRVCVEGPIFSADSLFWET